MNPYASLALLLLAAGGLLLLAVAHLMARALTRPPRMTDGKALHVLQRLTPKDVGLRFDATTFEVDDYSGGRKLTLSAWWMPAEPASSTKTVVFVHGYADAKVGALAWARPWHDLGWNLLAVDLRAHGDSGGILCTGGFAERHDLEQVVHQLVARKPSETQTLVLFGVSLGAAAVAGAAALICPVEEAHAPRPWRLSGIVLESPFTDFRSAAAAHFELLGLPGGFIARLALRHAEWLTSARFADVRPIELISRTACPVLVLAAGDDAYLSPDEADALAAAVAARPAAQGPSVYRRFDGVEHLMGVIAEPESYQSALADFADRLKPRADG